MIHIVISKGKPKTLFHIRQNHDLRSPDVKCDREEAIDLIRQLQEALKLTENTSYEVYL